jgi:hypothetical protein
MWRGENERSAAVSDFEDGELAFFAATLDDIDAPALQARIGDLLWLRRRDHAAAEKAAAAYLTSSLALIEANDLGRLDYQLRRALDLAAELGKANNTFQKATTELAAAVARLESRGQRKATIGIIRALLHHRQGDAQSLATTIATWAEEAVAEKDWIWAQHWWEFALQYARLAHDTATAERALRSSARAFVLQTDEEEAKGPERFGVGAHWLQAAVARLQQVKGTRDERNALLRRGLALQEKSLGQMGRSSFSMNLKELVEAAEQEVAQPTAREAIIALARLGAPARRAELEDQTRKAIEVAPLSHILGTVVFDRRGRVKATTPALSLHDGPGAEDAFRMRVVETAVFQQGLHALAVDRAREVINDRHDVPFGEMLLLAQLSPFVPPRREHSFARGLYAGFRGDFGVAAHLLLPQLENALRWLLNRAGVVTISQDPQGVQKERNLGLLLEMAELEAILGPDTVFDLQALLVDEQGPNLRNEVAHGLVDDDAFLRWPPKYLWWSMLRLCVLPLLNVREGNDDPKKDDTKEDEEERPDSG